jgi:hypothetical protein
MTFCPAYVSSGPRNGEQPLPPSLLGNESGEHQTPTMVSSSTGSGEHGSSSVHPRPRPRRLRESRKTPFSQSPTSRSSHFLDDGIDAILETQRLEDAKVPSGDDRGDQPKRKREKLSDSEYRLRKERTDGLIDGYRQVYERSFSSSPRVETQERDESEIDEKGESVDCEDDLLLVPLPVPEDLDPPPAYSRTEGRRFR